ncbi:MAG TPA: methionyl-tRNA formyltransferase [Sandaracinaceae bacterium]
MRAIFFGTPQLAVPSLESVAKIAEVVRVVCQPDRPAGRGMKLTPPPVKVRALELGLEVEQPTKVKTPEFAASLRALEVDVAVVVAYGRILPRAVLDAPRRGCVNVHASLLPRWRGAGPIQWAIASGDRETGVCLMQMDEGLDTGPIIACERTPIDPDETSAQLGERLARMGAALLEAKLPAWVDGRIEATPQSEEGVTYAPLLTKEDGRIDWNLPARAVHDRVRAMQPWPVAYAFFGDERVLVHATAVRNEHGTVAPPGTIVRADAGGIEVACGRGTIAILELQLEGRKRLGAKEHLAGRPWTAGQRFDPRSEGPKA